MKNLINIVLVVCSLFMVSCDFFGESKSSEVNTETKKIEILPDSVEKHINEQGKFNKDILESVDALTHKLNETSDSIAQLKATIEKLESPTPSGFWHFITLVAFAFSVITLLLSFRSRGLNRKEVQEEFSRCLDDSTRIRGLMTDVDVLKKKSSSVNNYQPKSKGGSTSSSDVVARVTHLENKLKEVITAVNGILIRNGGGSSNSDSSNSTPKEDKYSKVIYAKINTDKYFTDIVNSNQEACVFVINLNNDKKGEFNLISLDKIKSRNGWQDVVEYTGSCLMSEATSYTVQDKGICEKIDDNTWEVKRKLKIKISK